MRATERLLPYNPAAEARRDRARTEAVANARTLEHATIGRDGLDIVEDGAVRLYDADGNQVIRIGLLTSGDYGIEAIKPDGTSVQLSTLAFEEQSQFDESSGARSELATWGDLSGVAVGPVVPDVRIGTTRRARVTLSATMLVAAGTDVGAAAFMGCEVSGATVVAPVEKQAVGLIISSGVGTSATLTVSKTYRLTNLTPGLHTFTARYIQQVNLNGSFAHRELIIQPY